MRVSPGTPLVGREGPYLLQIVRVMETEPVSGRRVRPMARGCLATEPAQRPAGRTGRGSGEKQSWCGETYAWHPHSESSIQLLLNYVHFWFRLTKSRIFHFPSEQVRVEDFVA